MLCGMPKPSSSRSLAAALSITASLGLVACGDDAPSSEDASVNDLGSSDAGVPDASRTDASPSDLGPADAGTSDPCSVEALKSPVVATNYYVAAEEPGADDQACDGLAPTDEGNGRCPFRSLDAVDARGLLRDSRGVRVSLRTGTYIISGWQGFTVLGAGTNESESSILSNYEGEEAVLDVPSPDGVNCDVENVETDPDCVRQLIVMSGRYSVVQGLIIRNGLAHHLEIRGGLDQLLRCNQIAETVSFGMRSDLVKLSGGATRVNIRNNRLSKFWSQVLDVTGVQDVVIEDNEIFDALDPKGGAFGTKYGSRRITVRNNRIHDVCPNGDGVVFSLGGTGSDHPDDAQAYEVEVSNNVVYDSPCKLAQFVACQNCRFDDNDVTNVGAGLLLTADSTGLPQCTTSTTGCLASQGSTIRRNRMRGLHGGGNPEAADFFIFADPGESSGLALEDNLYCTSEGGAAKFAHEGELLDFSGWMNATGSDNGSMVRPASDAACQ